MVGVVGKMVYGRWEKGEEVKVREGRWEEGFGVMWVIIGVGGVGVGG